MLNNESTLRTQSEKPRKRFYSSTVKPKNESNAGTQNERAIDQSERAIKVIFICIIVGSFGSMLYSSQATSAKFLSITGIALAIAGASLLAGSLLGFLFGIPIRLQHDSANASNQQIDSANQGTSKSISYQSNTNLEQISDWLTKILVGVGLTQLIELPKALQNYADFTASGLGNFDNSKVFAIALLIYFLICGFLITYLWTRIYLVGAFNKADRDAIGRLAEVENKVSELEKQQAERDVSGLSTVRRYLIPPPDSQPILQEQLDAAVKFSSPTVREQIYHQVGAVLNEYWADPSKVTNLERTIPVYKALIASDTDNFLYHGELGIVLHVQRQPKQAEAESELTRAIELRGDWKSYGWVYLEFYRAECRIIQDENFQNKKESTPEFKEKIRVDLQAAKSDSEVKEGILRSQLVSDWLKLNEIPSSEFA